MERFDPCKTRACKQRCDSYGVACEDICIDEIERLRSAIKQTLDENGHLADGENCTLIVLKRALMPNNQT